MNIVSGIIADDFTGAGDSSIYFCHAGYTVFLPFSLNSESIPEDTAVLAINTESRLLNEKDAYAKVCLFIEKCREIGVHAFYKKIDSTLRGNIASEVNAVMDTADYKAAVICPAAPSLGRTVLNGQCLINNQTIKETESSKDHLNPVNSAYIRDLFPSVEDKSVHHFSIAEVEKGSSYLNESVNRLLESGITHIICDAETHEHLMDIASLFKDERLLPVGAAGLAKAISSTWEMQVSPDSKAVSSSGQILILSGSKMDVSRKQISKLSQERTISIREIPVNAVIDGDKDALDRFQKDLGTLNTDHPIVFIPSDCDREESPEEIKINSENIADFMADSASLICRERDIPVMVIIGGHTTHKTITKMNAHGVLYKGEVIPGTPYGELIDDSGASSLFLVTKSGSFGDEDALINIVDFVIEHMVEK